MPTESKEIRRGPCKHGSPVVPALRMPLQIQLRQLFHLFFRIIYINRTHGDVHDRVAHSRVFPVDETHDPSDRRQEIIHVAVNVGQGLGAGPDRPASPSAAPYGPERCYILKQDAAVGQAQMLIKINPLPHVKGMVYRQAGMVELPENAHAGCHLLRNPGGAAAVLIVLRFCSRFPDPGK